MSRQTTRRPTQRRRCWLEQCEARQMLSVAPMQSPQATLVTQSLAMQLSASRVTSELTVTGNIGGALLSSTGGQFSLTIKNSFGEIVIPQGTMNGLFPIAPDAVGELDVEPWRVYQPPSIDPIPPAPINQPPADPIAVLDPISVGPIAMPAPVSAPQPISASDPISPPPIASGPDPSSYLQRFVPPTTSAPTAQVFAPEPGLDPTFAAPPATAVAPSRTGMPPSAAMDGNTTQRWLSVSFSPAEERHLDAAALDGRYGSLVATRDPQARFALEPTRVTFQAFCVSTNPQSSALGVGTEPISTSKPAQRESEATEQSLQSHDEAQCDATSAAASAAAHDAAILDWDTPQDAPQLRPFAATGLSEGTDWQHDTSGEPADERSDDGLQPLKGAMEFVVEHKHVVAPVLAGIAMTSLWFRAAKQSAEAELERSRANPAIKGRRPLCELDS